MKKPPSPHQSQMRPPRSRFNSGNRPKLHKVGNEFLSYEQILARFENITYSQLRQIKQRHGRGLSLDILRLANEAPRR